MKTHSKLLDPDFPRKTPQAIIKSFEMDPTARILFVEGPTDRLFFEYLSDSVAKEGLIILEIDTVEIPSAVGGAKGRLITLAKHFDDQDLNVRFFLDADFHYLSGSEFPSKVILTDYRDLESYLFNEPCIKKFLKLGIKTEKITAAAVIEIIKSGLILGLIRFFSFINDLRWPINDLNKNLTKYFTLNSSFEVSFNLDKYLSVLRQKANNSFEIDDVKEKLEELSRKHSAIDYRFVIQGKDGMFIISQICNQIVKTPTDFERTLWTCFDVKYMHENANLHSAIAFITEEK